MVGFQDPDLTTLKRDSPTLSLRSRLLFLAYVAAAEWELEKGGIKNASLQGDPTKCDREVYDEPPPEL